jgi:hypothetical protein
VVRCVPPSFHANESGDALDVPTELRDDSEFEEIMKSRSPLVAFLRQALCAASALFLVCLGLPGRPAQAKEAPLTAIEVYDGPAGAAYVQLTEVLINGKDEMRECPQCQSAPIDKSTYGKLSKLTLEIGGELEFGSDGILRYSLNNGPARIVLPFNVKFDHKGAYSDAELADQAILKATPVSAGSDAEGAVPPLKKGVKLVFIAAPDADLGEYLRAQRAADVPGWQAYLSKYPASAHSSQAKLSLATLFVSAGQASLTAYEKSASTPEPSYSDLKIAKTRSEQAHALEPQSAPLIKLDAGIGQSLTAIVESARSQLTAYHVALNAASAGYAHLQNARKIDDIAGAIDPTFKPYLALLEDILRDANSIQSELRQAESARDAKQFDQALATIGPYLAFADEEPRIAAIINDDYNDHMAKGKEAEAVQKWDVAIAEYEKAGKIKASPDAADSLKQARQQLALVEEKGAIDKALESSAEFERAHDILRAYEVLENLPPAQKAKVSDDLNRLQPAYIESSSQAAKDLRQAHDPIRGLADEIGMEKAYKYLQHAYELSNNESYRDRMELLANTLSAYLLDRAKHYLEKPAGSGTELGWMYLTEALPYKASNLGDVRDTMVAASAAHAIRSKLSIRVQFRDQTSQRDSAGFAGQLENAIITGLEGSGIPVKVVRGGETTPVEPDFQLTGDVIQHHMSVIPTVEAVDSKYRASEKEIPSEEWNKANRAYEKAELERQAAQASLQGAEEAKKGKKEIMDLNKSMQDALKRVEDAHVLLDSTPRTVTEDVIRPYTYTRRTIDLSGAIQLQFRVGDTFSGQMAELVPTTKEVHKQFVLLENVKPEDTTGIKAAGSQPDEGEFLTELESSALEALVMAVRKRVEELPQKIYAQATSRESDSDLDGAGESFLRFLNSVRGEDSNEQKHARQFLGEQFNMHPIASITP